MVDLMYWCSVKSGNYLSSRKVICQYCFSIWQQCWVNTVSTMSVDWCPGFPGPLFFPFPAVVEECRIIIFGLYLAGQHSFGQLVTCVKLCQQGWKYFWIGWGKYILSAGYSWYNRQAACSKANGGINHRSRQ